MIGEYRSRAPFGGREVYRCLPSTYFVALLVVSVWIFGGVEPVFGRTFMTVAEALELVFPRADDVARSTAYLTKEQLARARDLAGPRVPVESALVGYYVARRDGKVLGTAYLDTHLVRTLPETVMIVVDPHGKVAWIEILGFKEPPDYLPPKPWIDQFPGRPLGPALSTKGAIRGITGATLTARAITAAVRRVLALHAVIDGAPRGKP